MPCNTVHTMTIDNKHNFADAKVLFDSDYFPSTNAEPVQAVLVSPANESDVKTPVAVPVHTASVSPVNESGAAREDRDPDIAAHNVQHKKNVMTGVISGVAIGLILFGPVGAIAGGFIGSTIVNRRERRWNRCHHHGVSHRLGRGRQFVHHRGRCHRW